MKKSIIFFVLLFAVSVIIAGQASALEDSEAVISSDSGWIVAGGTSATISVSITNSSCTISYVVFGCTDSGTYGDVSVKTVTDYPFTTYFSSTKSGTANIEAQISYTDNDGNSGFITKTLEQKIDHAVPDKILNVSYLNEVTVGEVTPIAIRMSDRYGNLIDSKYEDENGAFPEYLEIYCSPSDSYLFDGTDYTLDYAKVYVDSTGVASINYRVSQSPINNQITIDAPNSIESQYRTIKGIANAEPFSIIAGVNPNNGETPYLPADDESKFYISYYLFDRFGNPAGNRTIHISTSNPNDLPFDRTSDSEGLVSISYGPSPQKSVITLDAYSVDNVSVHAEIIVMFDSTEPVDMLLTANPAVMPSHDVSSERTSAIRAKVIDERGNPVADEVVAFSIEDGLYPPYSTYPPSLSAASAATDEDGQAIVYFKPGSFIYDTDSPLYEILASANCTVKAQWDTVERQIIIEWKNFPYLSVETEVSPETVALNGTVDVTVRLIGDGWALQPDPIDVMLSADRSGSMLQDYPDRMVTVMGAMKGFTSAMSEGRDRIGLTSFGNNGYSNIFNYAYNYHYDWIGRDGDGYSDDYSYVLTNYNGNKRSYSGYATLDLPLTMDYTDVDDEIDSIVPMMGTPMRGGIYLAIKELVNNGADDAVKAVVVLSDGDYSTGTSNGNGDPLAREKDTYTKYYDLTSSEQNLAVYAKNNDIRIYAIAFADTLSSVGRETLRLLAEGSDGEFYDDVDASNINDVYKEIAGELKTEAGVNTQMYLDFSNIELNNVTVPNTDLDPIMEYVYSPDNSTVISKWNKTDTVIQRHTVDDTDQWTANRSLSFDVGTIKLSETWETTFRLKLLKCGNINLFSPNSKITFNNGTDSIGFGGAHASVVNDYTPTGIDFKDLAVTDLHYTNTGKITDTLNLAWNISYTGEYSASQNLYYMRSGDDVWILFKTMTPVPGPAEETDTAQLVVKELPPGEYSIRVHAKSDDTADSVVQLTQPIIIGDNSASYIKIE